MTFSAPSCRAAATSAAIPPPASAEVATDQLTGLLGLGLTEADGDTCRSGDECTPGDDCELPGDDEHPAATKATRTVPANSFPRPTPELCPLEPHLIQQRPDEASRGG
jgi:hypothetical protein